MKRALVVQHQDDCPPGLLGTWAADRGVELDVVRPDRGERLPEPAHSAVVVLGSDKSVNDDTPWIVDELRWLRDVAGAGDVPVLGVCFGAQALAVALGGEVRREAPEIAWQALDVARGSEPAIEPGPWLCWHNDFIAPPVDAAILATTPRAAQAFRQGRHLGIQFHPEVTPEIVESWTAADDLGRDLARAGVTPADLRAQTTAHAATAAPAARRLFDAWARFATL